MDEVAEAGVFFVRPSSPVTRRTWHRALFCIKRENKVKKREKEKWAMTGFLFRFLNFQGVWCWTILTNGMEDITYWNFIFYHIFSNWKTCCGEIIYSHMDGWITGVQLCYPLSYTLKGVVQELCEIPLKLLSSYVSMEWLQRARTQ